ncbi:unnamed protein product [Adineta ricciae]|uniref:G-protein coupled receptors family 1 profile domain-containing protein n=1 Tax=Adineta ricciae TaxID=249248 RepID=A0A814K5S1_ADIRI|nr:unnamed protein product [Adineta ricciae]
MVSFIIRFWTYLILLIPSILCTLFVLYHLLFDRTLRLALNNHAIIVLLIICLICQITIYPWMLQFYWLDDFWERSLFFCTLWQFLDWGLYVTQTVLFAWATIERHILIFHHKWMATKFNRFFIHYLPLTLLLLYCLLFYIILDFFPACENFYLEGDMICVFVCAFYVYDLYMYETIAHQLIPVFTIVIFSIILLLRTFFFKWRMRQPIQWRKYRKLAIQVLSISLIYLLFSFPFALITLLYLLGWTYSVYGAVLPFANFCSYLSILLFPFVTLASLPTLRRRVKNMLPPYRKFVRAIAARTNMNNRVHIR